MEGSIADLSLNGESKLQFLLYIVTELLRDELVCKFNPPIMFYVFPKNVTKSPNMCFFVFFCAALLKVLLVLFDFFQKIIKFALAQF